MSDMTDEERAQVHVLTHALAMGGWLSAPYFEGGELGERRAAAMAELLATDPPMFEFVDDPDYVPHQRFHLTPAGVDAASQLEWVEG